MTIATQTPGRQWIVTSETQTGVVYVVRHVNGQTTCDCLGHVHHGRCKHARLIEQKLIAQRDAERAERYAATRALCLAQLMGRA